MESRDTDGPSVMWLTRHWEKLLKCPTEGAAGIGGSAGGPGWSSHSCGEDEIRPAEGPQDLMHILFSICCARDGTQGLAHAKQVLYH